MTNPVSDHLCRHLFRFDTRTLKYKIYLSVYYLFVLLMYPISSHPHHPFSPLPSTIEFFPLVSSGRLYLCKPISRLTVLLRSVYRPPFRKNRLPCRKRFRTSVLTRIVQTPCRSSSCLDLTLLIPPIVILHLISLFTPVLEVPRISGYISETDQEYHYLLEPPKLHPLTVLL